MVLPYLSYVGQDIHKVKVVLPYLSYVGQGINKENVEIRVSEENRRGNPNTIWIDRIKGKK